MLKIAQRIENKNIIHTTVSVQKLMGVYPLCIFLRIGSSYLISYGILHLSYTYLVSIFIFILLSMIFPTYNKVEGKNLLENLTLIDFLLSILLIFIFDNIYSFIKYSKCNFLLHFSRNSL